MKKLYVISLAALLTGSLYTVMRKLQSLQMVEFQEEGLQQFNKPMYRMKLGSFQAFCIFAGMSLAMLYKPFFKTQSKTKSNKKPQNVFIFIVPSILDVIGTIVDTVGIYYTNVSVSQMLKGFVVVFTYLISIIIFRRKMRQTQHLGVLLIFLGQIIIGYSNYNNLSQKYSSSPILGNSLIVLSQLIFSFMFIYEQTILKHYDTKVINVVAWEGMWGLIISAIFLFMFSFMNYKPTNCNFFETCSLVYGNSMLMTAILVTALCIAPFNYFGMKITEMSSTLHRCTICSLRMVIVWIVSLLLGWEQFNYVQLTGYLVMTLGTFIFNEVWAKPPGSITSSEEQEDLQLVN